jgi:hypothetical protein
MTPDRPDKIPNRIPVGLLVIVAGTIVVVVGVVALVATLLVAASSAS